MKKTLCLSLLLVFALGGFVSGYGQTAASSEAEASEPGQVSAPIYFRLGKSAIDPTFMGNRENMDRFVKTLREILSNPDYVVNKVRVVGMASPDGSRERNLELAGARAQSLADFLIRETGISADKIEVVNGGENWDGLFAMIEASKDIPDKAKILEFRELYGEDRDKLKRNMQYYNGSRAWKYMYQHFFPILRTGAGGTDGEQRLSDLSLSNWQRIRKVVQDSDLDEETKQKILTVISQAEVDNLTNAGSVMTQLRALCPDEAVYARFQHLAVESMLAESNAASTHNWALLRQRIATSDIGDKEAMLDIIDNVPATRGREQQLRALNGGESYRQIERLYPELLTDLSSAEDAGVTSFADNWRTIRAVVAESDMPDKETVLEIIDTENDPAERERKLRELNDGQTYRELVGQALPALLSGSGMSSLQQEANRALLRRRIAASSIPDKEQALEILDRERDPAEYDKQLRALDGGKTYREIVESVVPELLVSEQRVVGVPSETTTVSAENWRMLRDMIAASNMPDKEQVLGIIDSESDPAERERKLRELNDGYADRYIKEVFFPELLYGISSAAKENWALLEKSVVESDMANKDEVLRIMQTTPAGAEREAALRRIDDGRTWETISRQTFTELLQNTEQVEASGTGMSFTFEASPAAKARAEELKRQQAEKRRQEEEARQAELRRQEEARQAEERRRQEEQRRIEEEKAREAARLAAVEHRKLKASAALKTDFVLWGSLMPGFEMGSFMPNLSAEVYFAKRWSVQLGGGYSNWDALSGSKGLYAVTGVDLEPRWWLKNDGLYRGFYAGVFGTYGDFDIQETTTGYTGTYFMGGVTGGWCQVLGRHLYLEAALRLGFRSAQGDNYTILNDHYYLDDSESRGKFAPQVRLQLVYRFGKSGK